MDISIPLNFFLNIEQFVNIGVIRSGWPSSDSKHADASGIQSLSRSYWCFGIFWINIFSFIVEYGGPSALIKDSPTKNTRASISRSSVNKCVSAHESRDYGMFGNKSSGTVRYILWLQINVVVSALLVYIRSIYI